MAANALFSLPFFSCSHAFRFFSPLQHQHQVFDCGIEPQVYFIITTSIDPFKRLVKLAARAFYGDITIKGNNRPKTGRSDNKGIAVVVLDGLTRRQWVRKEDLAKNLKLHSKELRRTLKFLEEEKLITRDHRRERANGGKIFSAAVAVTADGHTLLLLARLCTDL